MSVKPDEMEAAEREAFGNVCRCCNRPIKGELTVADRDADRWPRCSECALSPEARRIRDYIAELDPHAKPRFIPSDEPDLTDDILEFWNEPRRVMMHVQFSEMAGWALWLDELDAKGTMTDLGWWFSVDELLRAIGERFPSATG